MKKILIFLIVIIGIVLFVFKPNTHYDPQNAILSGDYETFYVLIKNDFDKEKKEAIELFMRSFFEAIEKGDTKQVEFYLSHNRTIIDREFYAHRAIDVSLFTTKEINIDMLKLLLSYSPDLNYKIPFADYLTPIKAISKSSSLHNKEYIIKLLIDSNLGDSIHNY